MSEPLRPLSERELNRQVAALQRQYLDTSWRQVAGIVVVVICTVILVILTFPQPFAPELRNLAMIAAMLSGSFFWRPLYSETYHPSALMSFGSQGMSWLKRLYFDPALLAGLKDVSGQAVAPLLDWDLIAETLRQTKSSRLRTEILRIVTQAERVEFAKILDEHYGAVGLNHRKLAHHEAAALATARLVLRPLATLEPGAPMFGQGVER